MSLCYIKQSIQIKFLYTQKLWAQPTPYSHDAVGQTTYTEFDNTNRNHSVSLNTIAVVPQTLLQQCYVQCYLYTITDDSTLLNGYASIFIKCVLRPKRLYKVGLANIKALTLVNFLIPFPFRSVGTRYYLNQIHLYALKVRTPAVYAA